MFGIISKTYFSKDKQNTENTILRIKVSTSQKKKRYVRYVFSIFMYNIKSET